MDEKHDPSTKSDSDWELEEGIPQPHEPVIQKYFQGRDALIAQEDKHRSGSSDFDCCHPHEPPI